MSLALILAIVGLIIVYYSTPPRSIVVKARFRNIVLHLCKRKLLLQKKSRQSALQLFEKLQLKILNLLGDSLMSKE